MTIPLYGGPHDGAVIHEPVSYPVLQYPLIQDLSGFASPTTYVKEVGEWVHAYVLDHAEETYFYAGLLRAEDLEGVERP